MTMEEWLALDEEERGELVDGAYEDGEMPSFVHETVFSFLFLIIGVWGKPRGARVMGPGLKFVLNPRRGRMPDMSVFLAGAKLPQRTGGVRTQPSIAIEIVTPTPRDERRDRVDKLTDYAEFGIPWYWIVDPALRTLEIWELGENGRYSRALAASEGIVDAIPACPDLALDLDALWHEIDSLPPDEE